MINRKKLKSAALKSLRKNYIGIIAVTFLLSFLTYNYHSTIIYILKFNNSSTNLNYISENFTQIPEIFNDIATIITTSFSYIFKFVGSIIHLFTYNFSDFLILLLAFITEIIYIVFFSNPFKVGTRHYYLNNTPKTKLSIILIPFKKEYFNITKVMSLLFLKQTLWNFTIIGGIIKHYEYKFIPYILAEHPEYNTQKIFNLSKKMSRNKIWSMIKLDLSFTHYFILNFLTLGLSSILFSSAYHVLTEKELYLELKKDI